VKKRALTHQIAGKIVCTLHSTLDLQLERDIQKYILFLYMNSIDMACNLISLQRLPQIWQQELAHASRAPPT
jgi:hypothetical protein